MYTLTLSSLSHVLWGAADDRSPRPRVARRDGDLGDETNARYFLGVEEARLVARMRTGEHAAFEEVIGRYHAELVGYAATLVGSRSDADDLLQAVFLRLWRAHESLRVTQGIRAYLFAAVRNQAWNHLRGEKRLWNATGQYRLATVDEGTAGVVAPDAAALDADTTSDDPDAELLARAMAAIEQLPPRAREAWHLHHDQGLTYAEVAAVMDITVGTVKSQMARAIGLIRAAVEA